MCRGRRVFFACLHEDHDVTPPRQIIYCERAELQSDGTKKPCIPEPILPLTGLDDFASGLLCTEYCPSCQDSSIAHRRATDTSMFGSSIDSRMLDLPRDVTIGTPLSTIPEEPAAAPPPPEPAKDPFKFDWDIDKYLAGPSSTFSPLPAPSAQSESDWARSLLPSSTSAAPGATTQTSSDWARSLFSSSSNSEPSSSAVGPNTFSYGAGLFLPEGGSGSSIATRDFQLFDDDDEAGSGALKYPGLLDLSFLDDL